MSPTDRIRQLLSNKPGLKAQQIANELGLDRSEVAAALHRFLGGEAIQDNAYRWWPNTRAPRPAIDAPRTFLARLCRYYLECLSRESGPAISLPAAAPGNEYSVLDEFPLACPDNQGWAAGRTAKRIVQKVRQERGQLALYVGYAIRVRPVRSGNAEENRIEPVLLYPLEETSEHPAGQFLPVSGIPLFNVEVLKSLPAADSGNVMDEALHLADELGLANLEEDLPPWDEIILRLRHCRPEWEWKEDLNPYALSHGAPFAELTEPGIYNRAVLVAGTRSPFTYGLETELRKLAQLDDEAVRNTALGPWVRDKSGETPAPEDRPLLEVVPLNAEQRQAVVQGLSAPLTVVTGPPGTGKSQVVLSLLVNVAWQGGSVLFSSKNNHAVDVVESRVNELGPGPLLLRLGREEHHSRLADHLTASLADSSSAGDSDRYDRLIQVHEEGRGRFAAVQREIAAVAGLRNNVDELERAAEPARRLFGPERFAALRTLDANTLRRGMEALSAAIGGATESGQPAVVRLMWDAVKDRRFERIAAAVAELRAGADLLGVPLPDGEPAGHGIEAWEVFGRTLADRLEWAVRVQSYFSALDRLRSAKPLESLARELTRIAQESGRDSLELWQCWLRLWPGRWTPEQRKLLAEYVSLLQMIASGERGDEGPGRQVFRRYYKVFPEVVKILPCWSVTSLSARGRLPFDAACFDLVVIDEASQCDIASALPLLYRARRAVIIGDPLQLRHVSAVAPQQDRMMLAAHGLAEGRAAWAYSVNSLFDLARGQCRHEDIVNLRDHHRSHRDIIAFSNRHFYRGRLRVVTDHEMLNRPRGAGPAVRWVDVKGRVMRPAAGGALNTVEAESVVSEVRQLAVTEGYSGAIGVVTPFRAQANRIRTLVHQDRELSQRLASMQFVVDTVHGFQGDERDVIFFSPVVSAGVGESTLRFLKSHGNLFNVAITRARSALVVVGDRRACLASGVAYLAGFAEYTGEIAPEEPGVPASAQLGPEYPPVAHPELVSGWDRIFYQALYTAGLRPVPQYEETPYTLDFALFDGDRKLDIEVDGENYHRNWDGELCRRDQIRSRRLSDRGWDILRVWVYEIRDDLAGSVARAEAWVRAVSNGAH